MSTYLVIGGHRIEIAALAEKLQLDNACTVELCQDVPSGTLVASVELAATGEYPYVDVDFRRKEGDSLSIPIFRAEQPTSAEEDTHVRGYFYGREDEYIAYMDVDTRSDAQVDEEGIIDPIIVASGVHEGCRTIVTRENRFVDIR